MSTLICRIFLELQLLIQLQGQRLQDQYQDLWHLGLFKDRYIMLLFRDLFSDLCSTQLLDQRRVQDQLQVLDQRLELIPQLDTTTQTDLQQVLVQQLDNQLPSQELELSPLVQEPNLELGIQLPVTLQRSQEVEPSLEPEPNQELEQSQVLERTANPQLARMASQ